MSYEERVLRHDRHKNAKQISRLKHLPRKEIKSSSFILTMVVHVVLMRYILVFHIVVRVDGSPDHV
jgi:hypothetical protein